jgi:hypothetical protein
MKLSQVVLIAFLVSLACVSIASAVQVAPFSGVNTNYTQVMGNDQMESFVNIPYTMEDVGYPETLFYALFFTGVAFVFFGFWLTSRADQIASYTLIGTGIVVAGIFAVCALMAPLVCTHQLETIIVPTTGLGASITLNATNTVYQIESVTYLFSPWISWALDGAIMIGVLLAILGVLSLYRTNKEKSIEPSVNQDGDSAYKDSGRKYRGDTNE